MNKRQLGSSLFLLLFGFFVSLQAWKLKLGHPTNPEEGFFPFCLGIALMIVSLMMAIRSCGRKEADSEPAPALWKGLQWKKGQFSLGILLLYAFSLEGLGYCLSTFGTMYLLLWVIGGKKWYMGLLISAIASFVTYSVFKMWLQVQLPRGLWEF